MRQLAFLAAVPVIAIAIASAEAEIASRVQAEAWQEQDRAVQISAAVRRERAEIIRDTAAAAGMTNGVLLAGIGEVETNFSHCWSEATWACQGPNSSSCAGGPVIAGSADGPCGNQQGGLGLFQFDSGTYSQTIATYGPDIVTMEGNVNAVVPFLVTRAIQSVKGVNTEQEALDWMNSIPIVDGDPKFEAWLYFISWRYNGCMGCTAQENKYRAGTHTLLAEMGAEFWMSSAEESPPDGCLSVSEVGTEIEESNECFVEFGPSQFWRHETGGNGGSMAWTKTTDNASASNYGMWYLHFANSGRYRLEAFTDGSFAQSERALYGVEHRDGTESVLIDQTRAGGWKELGSFEFIEGELYTIVLADNTGEDDLELGFDTVRITPVSGDTDLGDDGELSAGCGCTSSGTQNQGMPLLILLALSAFVWRKRAQ